ncbi:hypothetical protein C8Q75DRAFT_770319 [Abortiporus biennis]|nr:hypothetical protein C8Q75DRAFT_770319 [Abortiporus biennis]
MCSLTLRLFGYVLVLDLGCAGASYLILFMAHVSFGTGAPIGHYLRRTYLAWISRPRRQVEAPFKFCRGAPNGHYFKSQDCMFHWFRLLFSFFGIRSPKRA